jgi:hypothetical protein
MLDMDRDPCGISPARMREGDLPRKYPLSRLDPVDRHPSHRMSDRHQQGRFRVISILIVGLLRFCFVRLAAVICHVHAAQHVIGEEKFTIGRHHHDLQLVG